MRRRLLPVLAACALFAVWPLAADAKDGRPEVRSTARCAGGMTAELRLRARDGGIRTRFELDHARAGAWNVVLVHERRVAWKATRTLKGARGSIELERSLPDYAGSDAVSARATGPRGAVCQVSAVIQDVSDGEDGAEQEH